MPLVRIDVTRDRGEGAGRSIADAVHSALVAAYGIPERDRFQIVSVHPPGEIIAHDAGLGFTRHRPVVIQILARRGRTPEDKQRLYAAVAERLEEVGVSGEEIFIGCADNDVQDWSFGFGRAQFLTGEITIPAELQALAEEPAFV